MSTSRYVLLCPSLPVEYPMMCISGQCEPPEPVAILIFKDEIFVIKFNFFDWPLKRNLPLALYSVEKLPFEQIQRRSITDVQSAVSLFELGKFMVSVVIHYYLTIVL